MLIGFGTEALRRVLFAVNTTYPMLIVEQCLGGISAAAVTVLTVLMVADLTAGTGRFNLIQGFIGTVIAVAAAVSTGGSGFVFQHLGHLYGFLILAAIAVGATLLLWTALTETKPGQYLD